MEKDTVKHTLCVYYGLRRSIVPSKRLQDYCVEGLTRSFGKGLKRRKTLAWENGDSSASFTSFKGLLPLPDSAGPASSRSDGSSVLPQDIPGFLQPASYGVESVCRPVSGPVVSDSAVSSEVKGRRKKQARPLCVALSGEPAQRGLRIPRVPMVTQLRPTPLGQGPPLREDHQELGTPLSPSQSSTDSHGQIQQGGGDGPSSPDTDTDWTVAPRNTAAMFFPQLEDSSLKAETVERRKRETALQEGLRELKEPPEERFIRNAAVLPDLHQPTPQRSSVSWQPHREEPLLIHGRSVKQYQSIYHSVVDPMLSTPSGQPRRYSLDLGRRIKQRLWEVLFCPTLLDTARPDGKVRITETFCSPAQKRYAPHIEVDVSEEP